MAEPGKQTDQLIKNLSVNIRHALKVKRMTQAELAHETDASKQYISLIVNGNNPNITIGWVSRIADGLGFSSRQSAAWLLLPLSTFREFYDSK